MTLHEKKQYDQLRALARYQKIGIGPEALLFKKMLERRKAVSRRIRNQVLLRCYTHIHKHNDETFFVFR